MMTEILEKYLPAEAKDEVVPDQKVYVCPVCGYEYEGDLEGEPDDWTCPLCGQPKSAFKLKA